MKVAVGMSGGVDSSVAAVLLKEQGYDVTGITMSIWDDTLKCSGDGHKNSCYGPEENKDIDVARDVCKYIGIPFHVLDCSAEYKNIVIDNFKEEYLSARTPNPCVICNQKIKFDALLKTAVSSGIHFDKFATGHYAKVEPGPSGRCFLKKADDKKKDQSYFLYRLSQKQLSDVIFPLGALTKEEVRSMAAERGIAVSSKEDSQDFYSGNYRELLDTEDMEGDIVLTGGKVVGRHKGLWNYTPGQRRGMGIAFPEPLYVLRLDAGTNSVVVGTKNEICFSSFIAGNLNWISFDPPPVTFTATAKLRSTHREIETSVEILNDKEARVLLADKNEPVSPGQSAVFYDGDTVIGGGIIERVEQ